MCQDRARLSKCRVSGSIRGGFCGMFNRVFSAFGAVFFLSFVVSSSTLHATDHVTEQAAQAPVSKEDQRAALLVEIDAVREEIAEIDESSKAIRANVASRRLDLQEMHDADVATNEPLQQVTRRIKELEAELLDLRSAREKLILENDGIRSLQTELHEQMQSLPKMAEKKRQLVNTRWRLEGEVQAIDQSLKSTEGNLTEKEM